MAACLDEPACGMKGQAGVLAKSTTSVSGLNVVSSFSDSTVFLTGASNKLSRWGTMRSDKAIAPLLNVVWAAGATGFVGSVVLEQLMRLCPNFKRIYLLIRVKRGQSGKC